MLTAISAVAALFIAPRLAARNNQRQLVANSRQTWLDGLRGDVAELLAVWMQVVAIRERSGENIALRKEEEGRVLRADHLQHLVRLRLNITRANQAALFDAISEYVKSDSFVELSKRRAAVTMAMESLAAMVWSQIKSGRA
jgi:hypothetical protein